MESFEELAHLYEPMIYKIMHTLHIYRNKEEFFQLGLVGLWEARLRFNPAKGEFKNYAYTYIKGLFLTELTKAKRLADRSIYPKDEFWESISSPNYSQPFEVELLDLISIDLTEQQKNWLLNTCTKGLSVREIAELEKVSISTVKMWRKGAREKLKMYFK